MTILTLQTFTELNLIGRQRTAGTVQEAWSEMSSKSKLASSTSGRAVS
jgi:hypothetical protein